MKIGNGMATEKTCGNRRNYRVNSMKVIDTTLLDAVSAEARENSRLRQNYNFHTDLSDPINRLLNAMQPSTYVPPHRHINPDKEEICLVLRGSVMNFLFDDNGNVIDRRVIDPSKGTYGFEIEPGVWHSLVVLEPNTVIYEIKRGPYVPLAVENIAAWAPKGDDKEAVSSFIDRLLKE